MSLIVLRYIFLFVELILLIGIIGYCVYLTALLLSRRYDIPYVSTTKDVIKNLIDTLHLKPHSTFLELGCGDGLVGCEVAKQLNVKVRGIDVNPLFIFFAKLRVHIMGLSGKAEFACQNMFDTDFSWADTIYLFGMPSFIANDTLRKKLVSETKPNTLIISHWYPIPYLTHKQSKVIKQGEHETYLYE